MNNRKPRRFGRRILAFCAIAAMGGAIAQQGAAQEGEAQSNLLANTAEQLGLPEELNVFGDRDPNVRKPTAIVNGEIITRTDVDHRLNLFLAANAGADISEQEMQRLRMQVVRNLIDETLQIQEARANDIAIGQSDINTTFAEVAERSDASPDEFETFLRSQGSSAQSVKRQIEGELAWQRLLRRYVNPGVAVSQAEVQEIVQRLEATRGQTEYRVAEIYLSARPDNEAEVLANANRILEQVSAGASFQAYARQFSEASTAAVGGDLGWVQPAQLPEELAEVVPQIPVGGISRPIPVPGGFSILAVVDRRQILVADARDAVLSLKQISISFPEGATPETAQPRVVELAQATQAGGGCGAAEEIAARLGGEVVQNDGVRLGDLPEVLQGPMEELQVGQVTPPFGSIEQGVRVLILCGRDDPPQVAEPNADIILNRLEQERADRRARRYLRDLRRDAVIEYR